MINMLQKIYHTAPILKANHGRYTMMYFVIAKHYYMLVML
jgi:hypothetical protein